MVGRSVGAATLLVVALAGAVPDPAAGPRFEPLFDGQSLAGWVPVQTDRFTARDGLLVQDGGTGWLRTEKTYKDFELKLEYRALRKGADSGLFFRATAESTPKEPHWPVKGYQLQVIDAESHLMIFAHGVPPAQYERKADALRSAMKGPGEWQSITLKVAGKRAEVWLDGMLITVSDAVHLADGHLGLQAENGAFEWRDIRIRELPSS